MNFAVNKLYLKSISWAWRFQPFPHGKVLRAMKRRGLRINKVLDVGAAWGGWSRHCMRLFPTANYFLIDPLLEHERYLLYFKSQFPRKIDYLISAAGSQPSLEEIRVQEDLVGSSFLSDADPRFLGKLRSVPIVTIDDLIDSGLIEIPNLLKIDVQGFELEVLDGAKSIFGSTEVIIMEASLFEFSENCPQAGEIITYMDNRDYVLYDIVGFTRRPFDGALAQIDIVFVYKESLLKQSKLWFSSTK